MEHNNLSREGMLWCLCSLLRVSVMEHLFALDVVLLGSVACVDLRALESCILEVIIRFEDSRYGGLR
jgi:hypothetical protein